MTPHPSPPVDAASRPTEGTPFRRLHPSTPFQGFVRSLPGFAILLLPVLTGRGGASERFFVVFALGYALFALPGIVLGYLRFRYRLTPEQVEIQSGVLSRRHRSIPLDRIQRVEIDRPLLPRLFGTARVRLMTGSGSGAEGSLQFVSVEEALALRAAVRRLQAELEGAAEGGGQEREPGPEDRAWTDAPESAPAEAALRFALTPGLLLRAGAMRFSLVYIAIAFSGLQLVGFTVEDVIDWIERADLLSRVPLLAASPLLALTLSVGMAVLLSWIAGVAVTIVRYFRFTLRADARRLYTERGLGGRFERALPRDKVQAVLYTSNPITRRFGYARLEVQTMGLDDRGVGREVLVPLARLGGASVLGDELLGSPFAAGLRPVSRRFVRRRGLRYSAILGAGAGAAAFVEPSALWALAALPLAWALAWAQWRAHGFSFDGHTLVVQHGALWRRQWHLPLAKFQTVERWANVFQRRQGLASVYADTAGAPDTRAPVIEDLAAHEAAALADALYAALEAHNVPAF